MKYLLIILSSFFFIEISNAQTVLTETFDTDLVQKNSPQRDYTKVKSIYSADAQELSSEWISNDFSLDDQGHYSTGPYPSNASLSTRSNPIALPALEENQKILLQLKGFYHTEYIFDPIIISISTDGGENFTKIAVKSGRGINWDEDFDLSQFAEKNAIISFNLIADESYEGEGLSLDSMDIFFASYSPSFSLRSEGSEDNLLRLVRTPITQNYDNNCVKAGKAGKVIEGKRTT